MGSVQLANDRRCSFRKVREATMEDGLSDGARDPPMEDGFGGNGFREAGTHPWRMVFRRGGSAGPSHGGWFFPGPGGRDQAMEEGVSKARNPGTGARRQGPGHGGWFFEGSEPRDPFPDIY